MLYQNAGQFNLPAHLRDIFQCRGGCNAALVFCRLSFPGVMEFRRLFSVSIATQYRNNSEVLITSISFMCLMTIFSFVVGATNVFAAERGLLGNTMQFPLSASSDPAIVKKLLNLRQQANLQGSVRIIIGVRVAYAAEGTLDAAGVAQQRKEIAQMQSLVLDKIPALKLRPENIKRYSSMPFMALEVNATVLEALLNLNEITSIEEDSLVMPLLK